MTSEIENLLVEDNDLDADSIERIFRKTDTAKLIFRALDCIDALEILHCQNARSTHTLLLYLTMPRMDGLQCLAELRPDRNLRNTPVSFLTTSDDPQDIDETYKINL